MSGTTLTEVYFLLRYLFGLIAFGGQVPTVWTQKKNLQLRLEVWN